MIKEEPNILYMVIERYKDNDAIYKRFHEKGRMMPDSVSYVNSHDMSERMAKNS